MARPFPLDAPVTTATLSASKPDTLNPRCGRSDGRQSQPFAAKCAERHSTRRFHD
jgi:hypothetical protein